MPQYFFHSENGERVRDKEGAFLADDGAARIEAIRLAGALIADQPDSLMRSHRWRMLVTDSNEAIIFALEVFPVPGRQVTPWPSKQSAG